MRQRLKTAQQILQENLTDGAALLSIPCGYMADLLTLDYSRVNSVRLVGADLDTESIEGASQFAAELGLADRTSFVQTDVWDLQYDAEFDQISCLGLIPYVTESRKEDLFRIFFKALKKSGKLLAQFRTAPKRVNAGTEMDLSSVPEEDARLSEVIYSEIFEMRNSNFSSSASITRQLLAAGFSNVEVIFDQYKVLGIAVAQKD